MYLFDKTYYVLRDITFNRSMAEVVSGILLVTLATCGLLVVIGLSNGVDQFVSEALKKARPVIGTVVIKAERTGTDLSKETLATLKDWEQHQTMTIGDKSYAIDGISWISAGIATGRYMRFGIETDDEEYKKIYPTIQAIRGDDELLNPDFGVHYIDGGEVEHQRFTDISQCELDIKSVGSDEETKRLLANFKSTVNNETSQCAVLILESEAKDNKKEWAFVGFYKGQFYEYQKIDDAHDPNGALRNELAKDEPQRDNYKIVNFALPTLCPVFEVIVNQRFLEREKLKSQKTENDACNSPHLSENKSESLTELSTETPKFFVTFQQPLGEGFDKKALPPLKLPVVGVIDSREAPYPDMFINYWVARAAFQESPKKAKWHRSYALQFCDAEGNRLLNSLSGTPEEWCRHPGGQLSLSWQDDSGNTISVQDNSSEYRPIGCNIQKELENVGYRKALVWLSDFENADRACIVKLIEENVADVTADFHGQSVGKSLKRTAGIIEIFANWAEIGLMMLTIFATMIFGFGHIRRKRQDIGLLKSCGLDNKTTVTLFLSQIMLVCATGFLIGLVLVWVGLPVLEAEVRAIVQELTNQAVPKEVGNLLLISGMTLRDTALFIFFGMLVGSIIPIIQAIKVRPAVGLRTQL